jgi:uncharacterized protein (TIGR03437 family)
VQPIRLFVSSTTPVPFQASVSTVDGADWLSIDQTSGVTSTQNTTVLSVTADASHLAPGVYTGDVTVAFPNRVIRTTNITIVVPNRGPAPSAAKGKSASGCAPSRLSLTQTGLVNSFAAPAGWPEPLIVRLADDCGDPVLDAQMIATFSNGDPPAIMKLSNPQVGLYSATWSPSHPGAQVRVTARASSAKLGDASTEIIGGVSVNKAPILAPNGTRGNANPVPGGPLAPGSIAQISGLNLATSDQAATGSPLPVSLNGTTVLIGARQAPVFSVSPGALKVQIPAELEPGREYSVMVGVDGAYATPDTLSLAPVQPAIFTDENGMSTAQGAGSTPISEASPARSGDIITIFVEGMGATTPPVSSGTAVDTLTNVQAQPVVTIAGVPAEVISAGLMPGAIGVYAIRLRIPSGIAAGDLSLIVTQNGIASNTAVLPVQ